MITHDPQGGDAKDLSLQYTGPPNAIDHVWRQRSEPIGQLNLIGILHQVTRNPVNNRKRLQRDEVRVGSRRSTRRDTHYLDLWVLKDG
ncbi:hypothetical protein D3C72_2179530 [compost metagenome]